MTANIEFGYLEEEYLVFPYLAGTVHAGTGVELFAGGGKGLSVELFAFTEETQGLGVQLKVSNVLGYVLCEGVGYLEQPYLEDPYLAAYQCVGLGVELDVRSRNGLAVELNVENYNDQLFRVMCDIPSRGNGTNWTSNSTMTSATDAFNINNVNNDLEESVWRSASGTVTGVQLDNDAGAGNSLFVNTIFIRNHNFTTSANISLLLSDDPTFTVVGQTIDIDITDPNHFYYIAEDAPLSGFRYSRWNIDDPTNTSGYLQMAVVGYGGSEVFEEDCFTLPIESEDREYADVMPTEAFTNIMNFRAKRRELGLNFRNMHYDSQDWKRIQRIFDCVGTTQKALWIPTPQQPYRYGTWAKLRKLPKYINNDIGTGDKSYINFRIQTDEAL